MVFRPGPVFTQLLLADEINRTPPKTQAALLEAMAEGQVSVDGQSRKLPAPFIVLATDNPIEYEGDRKSTRLNSSHANISYAVFCLKKNKTHGTDYQQRCHARLCNTPPQTDSPYNSAA